MPSLRAAALPVFLLVPSAYADVIARSPDGVWNLLDRVPAVAAAGQPWIRPPIFKPITLNAPALIAALAGAPMEFTPQAAAKPLIMWFPMPDGTFARFRVVESPIMEAPLAAEFPDIRTYAGQGIDDPFATVRFDFTPLGFHSQLLSPSGAVYIDPYSRNDTTDYSVYYKRDYTRQPDGWTCLTHADAQALPRARGGGNNTDSPNGNTLRTYRLACAADGEYVAFFGGTVPLGQAAVVTAINRVDGVYETELSVRMVLVANNSSIIYTNATTDPYTNTNGGTMLGQNQTTCDSVIGTANYDIGHVFSTGGGGIAGLGVVTVAGNKARGVTGLGSPTGDAFYIDYVAHEMGHQFGSNHCFNSQTSNCGGGNRNAGTAYEPGSASTIMGYAGICGADDLQPHSDPYFLFASLDEIISFVNGHPGNTNVATGNALPTVNGGTDYTIPSSTPFTLTASGSDANSDPITYNWEERDLGPAATVAAGDNGTSPIIRSFLATTSPSRTIPRLANLLANTFFLGEILPTTTRTLNFRVTIRDNRIDGGVGSDDVIVHVINTGAPFLVTSPNSAAVTWPGASTQTVTWNVAGTTANGINCANVDILLSTDGGNTFPTTLLAGAPNNGSANVFIPNSPTTTARIKVAGTGNIFFDMSNANFRITAPTPPPNDACSGAIAVGVGSTPFTTVNATTDGPSEPGCNFPVSSDPQINQDVWFSFVAPCTGTATASTCGANYDSKIAIYAGGCPAGPGAIACNDDSDACGVSSLQSTVTWPTTAGTLYTIRVGGYLTATGSGSLTIACASCYANCDGSTTQPVLNVLDFACFLNRYAAGDLYANCDGSTTPPVLNVLDFACFLNTYAAGCP